MTTRLTPAARASLDAIPEGACLRLDLEESSLIALRREGALTVFLNRCPHRGTELDWSPGSFLATDGHHLQCATHGALFDPATGQCISGPCTGQRLERVDLGLPGNGKCT